MRQADIFLVQEKCYELLRRIERLEYHKYPTKHPMCIGGKDAAAVRRQSIELSRALADLRNPWRKEKGETK